MRSTRNFSAGLAIDELSLLQFIQDCMSHATLDPKVVELGRTVFTVRQDLDIHRIIGLNVKALEESGASSKFFGRLQQLALTSVAINLCAIFEDNPRYPLCSIPTIISDLPKGLPPGYEREFFEKFVISHGGTLQSTPDVSCLRSAYDATVKNHASTLERLKTFRNKKAVHLEFGFKDASLPSHNAYEALWEFACDFYSVVNRQYNDVCPAPMGRQIAVGLEQTLKQLGIRKPVLFFPKRA